MSPDLIRVARESCDLTLVVGGGIRDGVTAREGVRSRRGLGDYRKPLGGFRGRNRASESLVRLH